MAYSTWSGVSFLGFDHSAWLDPVFQKSVLLDLLGSNDLEQLRPHLQALDFEYKQVLYEPNRPIECVHFPVTGVASLVNAMENGSAVEVGTIGNEGMVGLPIALGDPVDPSSAYVQVPGSGLRLRASILEEKLRRSSSMRRVMLHYAHAFFSQIMQSAACAHFIHSIRGAAKLECRGSKP